MHFSVIIKNVRFWYCSWIKLITLSEATLESEQNETFLVFVGKNHLKILKIESKKIPSAHAHCDFS